KALEVALQVFIEPRHVYAVATGSLAACILSDVIMGQPEPVHVGDQVEQAVELASLVLFGPQTELPLHFADVHRVFTPYRLPLLGNSQQTAALRPVVGFPDLRLLWRLRRSPGFSSRLLGTSVSGEPLTFMLMDSTG